MLFNFTTCIKSVLGIALISFVATDAKALSVACVGGGTATYTFFTPEYYQFEYVEYNRQSSWWKQKYVLEEPQELDGIEIDYVIKTLRNKPSVIYAQLYGERGNYLGFKRFQVIKTCPEQLPGNLRCLNGLVGQVGSSNGYRSANGDAYLNLDLGTEKVKYFKLYALGSGVNRTRLEMQLKEVRVFNNKPNQRTISCR